MATYNKFNQFVEDVAHGVHNLSSDTITVALCNASNAPVATNETLADLTVVSVANLDDVTPTLSSSSQTSGTYSYVLTDHTMQSTGGSTGPFRYVVLYNDTPTTPADPLICWFDYGSEITLSLNESLLLDFSTSLFTLA